MAGKEERKQSLVRHSKISTWSTKHEARPRSRPCSACQNRAVFPRSQHDCSEGYDWDASKRRHAFNAQTEHISDPSEHNLKDFSTFTNIMLEGGGLPRFRKIDIVVHTLENDSPIETQRLLYGTIIPSPSNNPSVAFSASDRGYKSWRFTTSRVSHSHSYRAFLG